MKLPGRNPFAPVFWEGSGKKKTILAVGLLLASSAMAFADDAKTIAQRLDDSWIAAYEKGDAAALTGLYTSNAALLPHGVPQPIVGTKGINDFMDAVLDVAPTPSTN